MVQTLLNEAIDLLSRGEDEVRDGEVAIATGEQLLQQAINLSQVRHIIHIHIIIIIIIGNLSYH